MHLSETCNNWYCYWQMDCACLTHVVTLNDIKVDCACLKHVVIVTEICKYQININALSTMHFQYLPSWLVAIYVKYHKISSTCNELTDKIFTKLWL
jgi:hypothetical protein